MSRNNNNNDDDTGSDAGSSSRPVYGGSRPGDPSVQDLLDLLYAMAEEREQRDRERASRESDRSAKCARVTMDNARARREAEAAGCHVRDFATGYATSVSADGKGLMK
ncbi:uncharacterized protein Z520_03622 [Fonsecaea multimorphosa CBS 102226]|uniref:Uncharacterized protein n=1 Tax=Fonsecaea multimorphosa CBS 102226 TaxID=1442371 RepID=A0A0D2HGF7_9EURO|nr:uncharacterized protein Z520_03622 [Fonsecaea multimorphosa CBS 102226]KIY00956.1 hypothetical protein Z520_03622 [Fonsecaea multimorphosa CBS 102226]OAL27541.1 hypothetical protein AYO22_03445 [Fonsecaea multimorphosa]